MPFAVESRLDNDPFSRCIGIAHGVDLLHRRFDGGQRRRLRAVVGVIAVGSVDIDRTGSA